MNVPNASLVHLWCTLMPPEPTARTPTCVNRPLPTPHGEIASKGRDAPDRQRGGAVRRKRVHYLQQPTGRDTNRGRSRPHRRRWPSRPGACGARHARVATAAEKRLSLMAQPNKTLRRPSWALFCAERHKGSERAFGFDLGAKARSDDDKAEFVGFRDDPAFSNGALGVEADGDGARRHVPS
jgi:hypothetical protein